ncbi:MAG: RHS repeat-associated core domain-containing protein, partial [Bryobacterales bacterium]|nr:RHS repeat-associated core domain-containing protein [Bryobacterales bacterium]
AAVCAVNNGNVRAQETAFDVPEPFGATQWLDYDGYNRIGMAVEQATAPAGYETCPGGAVWCRNYEADIWSNLWVSENVGWTASSFTPTTAAWFDANNRLSNAGLGIVYDAAGHQTQAGAYTFEYDGEGRVKSATINAATTSYVYDGEGRRVKKVGPSGETTVYVYDAAGQLAAEYGGPELGESGVQFVVPDHLGSTRLLMNAAGTNLKRFDYVPFGEEIPVGIGGRTAAKGYGQAADVAQRFTGKERDEETGLDYFGARYYSGAQGRFTSVDPSMLSTVLSNPQTWNRYTYALNNPLRYVDPNGELWVASGDANNPYSWVDECQKNQTCHTTIAANVGGNLRVYGSANAQAITNYTANEHGMINVATLVGNADANFESIQTAGREENYLGVGQAAALFNVAAAYAGKYPNDDPLVFTGGSTATGGPALGANGRPIHSSHLNGANVDLRYMGDTGTSLTGNTAAGSGNVERNQYIINQFAGQNAGLGAALTGDPARYGLGPIPARLQQIHRNHMHFQRTYPAPPREEQRIRPGQR